MISLDVGGEKKERVGSWRKCRRLGVTSIEGFEVERL